MVFTNVWLISSAGLLALRSSVACHNARSTLLVFLYSIRYSMYLPIDPPPYFSLRKVTSSASSGLAMITSTSLAGDNCKHVSKIEDRSMLEKSSLVRDSPACAVATPLSSLSMADSTARSANSKSIKIEDPSWFG